MKRRGRVSEFVDSNLWIYGSIWELNNFLRIVFLWQVYLWILDTLIINFLLNLILNDMA